jgi:hypothetical protein
MRCSLLALAVTLALHGSALAAEQIPVSNWTVPPYSRMGTSGGLSTMADITPGVAFVGVAPCRLVDTRQAGFPAGYGQPALAGGVPRNFDLNSQPNCTGIPAGVEAYSLNFTVTNVQGPGFLKVFPQGGAIPADISTLNYIPGQNIANAAIVPAGTGGGITVISGVSGTDLIIDINGYFTAEQNPQQFIEVSGFRIGGAMIRGVNSAFIDDAYGVEGITSSWSGAGVVGRNLSVDPYAPGVLGISENGPGVRGLSTNFPGVEGQAPFTGILGSATQGGVGVVGVTAGGGNAGYGVAGSGESGAGVRGVATTGYGIFGTSHGTGAAGELTNFSNEVLATGYLGTNFGIDPESGAAPWGVFSQGDIGASGTKHFVDPHPTDASKAISYISLEGPEAGTYFRGRGRFQNGIARIAVPEHFRFVTDPEGLSVQVTPIGEMATVAVMKVDLEEIVVVSSRNVEFFYVVQGVRTTFKNVDPMISSAPFLPQAADARMPGYLSELQKRRLVENGTYNADGTVNLQTARRQGWDRMWEKKAEPRTTLPRE